MKEYRIVTSQYGFSIQVRPTWFPFWSTIGEDCLSVEEARATIDAMKEQDKSKRVVEYV